MEARGAPDRAQVPFAAGDPLRGLAALAVAISHVVGLPVVGENLAAAPAEPLRAGDAYGLAGTLLEPWGTIGVSVFFVLSGYLLGRPFVRAFVHGDRAPSLARYARHRLLRIVPAYWTVLTILVLAVVATGVESAGAGAVVRSYLFDGGTDRPLVLWIGQAWTLDVEVRFYAGLAVAGAFLIAVGRRARWSAATRLGLVAVLALGLVAWSVAAHPARGPFLATGFGENAGRFSGGLLLAALEVSAVRAGPAVARFSPALLFLGAVGLVLAGIGHHDASRPPDHAWVLALTVAATAVVAAPLLRQWAGHARGPAVDSGMLHWLGRRSYALYLVHVAVYQGLLELVEPEGLVDAALLLVLVGLPVALLAAVALHRIVERPFLRLRSRSQAAPASGVRPSQPSGG